MADTEVSLLMLVKALDQGAGSVFANIAASAQAMAEKAKASAATMSSSQDSVAASSNRAAESQDRVAAAADSSAVAQGRAATAYRESAAAADLQTVAADKQVQAYSKADLAATQSVASQDAARAATERLSVAQDAQAASATASAEKQTAAAGAMEASQVKAAAAQDVASKASRGAADAAETDAAAAGKSSSAHSLLGGAALIAAAGVGIAAAKSLEAASAYNQQSVQLSNTAGISTRAAKSIGDAFLSTAGTSTFSAQQIISAYTPVAGELGQVEGHALSNKEAMQVMSGAMDLAEASGMSLDAATNDVANTMKLFHLNTSQASEAANTLYNTSRLSGLGVDQINTAINRLAPSLAGTGVTIDQTNGLLLEMTSQFGNGRKAIGLIGNSLQSMADPSKAAQKAMQDVGISVKDANGNYIGLGPTLDKLKTYLDSNASSTEKNALMQAVFGKNALDMTQIVEGGSAALQKYTEQVSKKGAVESAAERNSQTLEGEQKKLKAIWDDMKVVLGEVLLPIITEFARDIMKVIGPIATWVSSHQALASAILKVALVLGTLIGVMLAVSKAIAIVNAALLLLAANPVVALVMLIVAAVVALGVAIYELVTHWSTVWNAIKTGCEDIYHFFVSIWNTIYNFFVDIWNKIFNFVKAWWPLLFAVVTGGASLILGAIIKYHTEIYNFIVTIWNTILNFFKAVWNNIYAAVSSTLSVISNAIHAAWNAISSFFQAIWNSIYDFMKSIWSAMYTAINAALGLIWRLIQTNWNNVYSFFQAVWNAIYTFIRTIWTSMLTFIQQTLQTIYNIIVSVWNNVQSISINVWNAISSAVYNIWNGLRNAAASVFTAIQNVIQGVWNNIKAAAVTMWNAIVAGIQAAWNGIKAVVRDPINVVIKLVDDFVGGAKTVLDAVGVHILDSVHINPVNFAGGGVLGGFSPGSDSIPAMLSPGEGILTPYAVRGLGGAPAIHAINKAFSTGGPLHFADGGTVLSGGMSNGVFHGAWHDNVNNTTYQDTNPSGPHFVDAQTLTGYVNGTGAPAKGPSGISQVAGAVGSAVSAAGSFAGGVANAVKGLAVGFIKGALIAAAHVALDPIKLAIDATPSTPMAAGLAKGVADKGVDGIFSFISNWDNAHGVDPAPSGGLGNGDPSKALAYAIATFKGLPYTWGNNDCSGIVQKSYSHIGVSLPRTSSQQWGVGASVDKSKAVPGDLVFYNPGTSGAPAGMPGHVGFFVDQSTIFDAYNTSRPIGYDPIGLPGNTFMGIKHVAQIGGGGGGSIPGGTVGMWISQALAAEGWPSSWAGAINTIIMRESGGNPNAINLTDSNAKAGDPSKGLMQVIHSTFEAYRDPKLPDNQYDPVANIVAAVRYILARYGSVAAVAARPGGYAVGAWDTGYEAHMAMIHPREMIIPAGPAESFRKHGFGGGHHVHHHVHLDNCTFMDDRSMDTLMDKIDKHFVQKVYPTAGYQARI